MEVPAVRGTGWGGSSTGGPALGIPCGESCRVPCRRSHRVLLGDQAQVGQPKGFPCVHADCGSTLLSTRGPTLQGALD